MAILAAVAAGTVGFSAPVEAAGEINIQSNWGCGFEAGVRSGGFVASSNLDEPGTVTAISVNPASIVKSMSNTGDEFLGNHTASAQFATGPGPNTVSFSVTVRWETGGANGGPHEATATKSLTLNACMPNPSVTFISKCDGTVTVNMKNGEKTDYTGTGGYAEFEVFGAYGYHAGPASVMPWSTAFYFVPAEAASKITVTGNGRLVGEGGYVAAPGCVGYVEPPPNRPATTSGRGSTSGGGVDVPAGAVAAPVATVSPEAAPESTPTPASAENLSVRTDPAEPMASPAKSDFPFLEFGGAAVAGLLVGLAAITVIIRRRRSAEAEQA